MADRGRRPGWRGRWHEGAVPVARPAVARLAASGLSVTAGGRTRRWPFRAVKVQGGGLAGEAFRLEVPHRGRTAAFVSEDRGLLEAIAVRAPGLVPALDRPAGAGRRLRLLAEGAVAAVLVLFLVWRFGIPVLARAAAARVPVSWEQSLGDAYLEMVAPPGRRLTEPAVIGPLNRVLHRMLVAVAGTRYRYRMYVLDTGMVNAFALPGGDVIVCRGLLEVTETPEQFAGVLAHEMIHVEHRHPTALLFEQSGTRALLALIGWNLDPNAAEGLRMGAQLGELRYSRDHEAEADRLGFGLLTAARIDPRGMVEIFEALLRMEGPAGGPPVFLSNHPATGDRLAALRELLARTAAAKPEPVVSDRAWRDLRAALRAHDR